MARDARNPPSLNVSDIGCPPQPISWAINYWRGTHGTPVVVQNPLIQLAAHENNHQSLAHHRRLGCLTSLLEWYRAGANPHDPARSLAARGERTGLSRAQGPSNGRSRLEGIYV